MVVAIVVAMIVVMVVGAVGIAGVFQGAIEQRRHGVIRGAGHAGINGDARILERILGAAAHAAADDGIGLHLLEESRQGAVAAAAGGHHKRRLDFRAFHIIKFELFRVAKVLEHFAVFIGDCNTHIILPHFLWHIPGAVFIVPPPKRIINTANCWHFCAKKQQALHGCLLWIGLSPASAYAWGFRR